MENKVLVALLGIKEIPKGKYITFPLRVRTLLGKVKGILNYETEETRSEEKCSCHGESERNDEKKNEEVN